jgi:hypothetical protein
LVHAKSVEKLSKRGRARRMAVMNRTEALFMVEPEFVASSSSLSTAPSLAPPRGLAVMSPAVVLPAANWRTILSRWESWSAFTGARPGKLVDPEQVVWEPLRQCSEKLFFWGKDAAGVNVICENELAVRAIGSQGTPDAFSFFPSNCMGHQLILSNKPSVRKFVDIVPNLVRGGHLWQSGRFHAGMLKQKTKLARSAEWKEVLNMPPESVAWAAMQDNLFKICRPCGDMTEKEEQFVKLILNGDPRLRRIQHIHVKLVCKCGGPG